MPLFGIGTDFAKANGPGNTLCPQSRGANGFPEITNGIIGPLHIGHPPGAHAIDGFLDRSLAHRVIRKARPAVGILPADIELFKRLRRGNAVVQKVTVSVHLHLLDKIIDLHLDKALYFVFRVRSIGVARYQKLCLRLGHTQIQNTLGIEVFSDKRPESRFILQHRITLAVVHQNGRRQTDMSLATPAVRPDLNTQAERLGNFHAPMPPVISMTLIIFISRS
ncbi:hypothetical protein TKWG_01800 [Advenella kashmirensis WT001]|uniref:Uncharacterized protein n=1 Tax=Advenella kashmirensis (strain DSM 17095 / LMG 22695 / WT001) TaxID=1036672 RepID=I3U7N0_ADVKW|nr:hypothetical protein TKWG_01800 [Advenella kashmirensis WT001]